jgi:hypothetical protein
MAHRRGVPEREAPRLRLYSHGWVRAERLGQVTPDQAWQLRSAKALVTLAGTAPRRRRRENVLDLLWLDAFAASSGNTLGKALRSGQRALEPELPPRSDLARLKTPDDILTATAEHDWVGVNSFQALVERRAANTNART